MNSSILVLADEEQQASRFAEFLSLERFRGGRTVFHSSFKAKECLGKNVSEVYVIIPSCWLIADYDKMTSAFRRSDVRRIAVLPDHEDARIVSSVSHKFSEIEALPSALAPSQKKEIPELGEEKHRQRKFTAREMQVLILIGKGCESREIINKLGIAKSTLSTHVLNLLNKTGLKTRCQLALYAMKKKLVSL